MKNLIATACILATGACATSPIASIAPVYERGVRVEMDGIAVEVVAVERQERIATVLEELKSEFGFLVVSIQTENLRAVPLELTFRPVAKLLDSSGREYAHSSSASASLLANEGVEAAMAMTEAQNPGEVRIRNLVWKVPPGHYFLQVIVPRSARANLVRGTIVQGRYFLVDLGEI